MPTAWRSNHPEQGFGSSFHVVMMPSAVCWTTAAPMSVMVHLRRRESAGRDHCIRRRGCLASERRAAPLASIQLFRKRSCRRGLHARRHVQLRGEEEAARRLVLLVTRSVDSQCPCRRPASMTQGEHGMIAVVDATVRRLIDKAPPRIARRRKRRRTSRWRRSHPREGSGLRTSSVMPAGSFRWAQQFSGWERAPESPAGLC